MPKGLIELNDACINLGIEGELVGTSAGYAVLDGDKLLIGEAGQQHAKLLPRWTNHRFWNQLNTDKLGNGTNAIRHHADLAFAHLEQMWTSMDATEVAIAVPAYYERGQLGLLLGMAKEAKIPVVSLVDLGLLSVANQSSHPTALFLDIGLHRITITVIRTDGALRLAETHTVTETGLATFWDRWAALIAEQFIQTSRFDPMHDAKSEQLLYNQLPEWIVKSETQSGLAFELELNGKKHSTNIARDKLLTACTTTYPNIVQAIRQLIPTGEQTSLFISHRFTGFPELGASLNLIPNIDIVYLPQTAALEGAKMYWEKLNTGGEAVPHITTLAITPKRPAHDTGKVTPSHLLVNHRLHRLSRPLTIGNITEAGLVEATNQARCTITRRGKDIVIEIHESGITINGESAETGQLELKSGDIIGINGFTATVVTEI